MALLGALVFVIVVPWHALNQRVPSYDGAQFVLTAQKIAAAFHQGLPEGLRALYFERDWRPIVFPTFAAPFFLLTGGKIRLSIALIQFSTAYLLAGYLYLFFRRNQSSWRALIGSLVILSAPWLVNFSNLFYSEFLWLAAAAGLLFHFSRAYDSGSRKHFVLAGLWLGVMGATRPVETAVMALIPAGVLIAYARRAGKVSTSDLVIFALQALLMAAALGLGLFPQALRQSSLLVCAALLIILACRRRFFLEKPVLGFLIAAEALAVAWNLPAMRALYDWTFESSFGLVAKITDQRFSGISPWAAMETLLESYSPRLLALLAGLALLAAPRLRNRWRAAPLRYPLILIGIALAMILPILAALLISGTSDMRRIMAGMLLVYAALTSLAVSAEGPLPRVRFALLTFVTAVQFAAAAANGLNFKSPAFRRMDAWLGGLRMPQTDRDPNYLTIDGIKSLGIGSGRIMAYTNCFRDNWGCQQENISSFEPMTLPTVAREEKLSYDFPFPGNLALDFSRPETLSRQIKDEGFDYVLVDMLDSPPDMSINPQDSYLINTRNFIAAEKNGLPKGLINRGCFLTMDRPICVIEARPAQTQRQIETTLRNHPVFKVKSHQHV